jgi:lipoprotein-anchoring transpeptidase ErfK/SrfK
MSGRIIAAATGAVTALIWLQDCSLAATIDIEDVNSAQLRSKNTRPGHSFDPVVLKAQVLLDRARFSPGEIDGRPGENFRKALVAFAQSQGLSSNGNLSQELWDKLTVTSGTPVLTEYTLTGDDVKGPFLKKLPAKFEQLKDLDSLGYTTPREAIAEKFHMSEKLLQVLNPGNSFEKAGDRIAVVDVKNDGPSAKVAKIEIDKVGKRLSAFGKDGQLLAVYPASIGSEEKPAPSGRYKIISVARNPTYTYNPEYRFKGVKATKPFKIEPGPNNPVGVVWMNLSLKGYGIHGTPEPGEVGKTESHGCIRLTNWDAKALAAMVEKGTDVAFLDQGNDSGASAAYARGVRGSSRAGRRGR